MIRRPFLTALIATALYAVVLVSTTSAELHRVRVTLATGRVTTFTVEVAPGATATLSQLPPLPAPPASLEDLGPTQVPTPIPTPELQQVPVPTPTVPNLPVPTPSGTPGGGGGGGGTVPDNPVTGGSGQGGGQPADRGAPAKGKEESPGANTESFSGKVKKKTREVRKQVREQVRERVREQVREQPRRPEPKPNPGRN